jgi:methylated-DNA-[protein]-cysteine S-methyltransferase
VLDSQPRACHTRRVVDTVVWTTLEDDGVPFRVAASARGVVAAAWEPDEDAFLADVAGRLRVPIVASADVAATHPARRVLDRALPVLAALLQGRPADAGVVPIDLEDRPEFDRRALDAVRSVRWGETASYGGIARRMGAPRAARAVGGALGRNPISLLIPCHRVIAGDGTLGGYGGDGWIDRERQRSRKEALLLREGVTVPRRAV